MLNFNKMVQKCFLYRKIKKIIYTLQFDLNIYRKGKQFNGGLACDLTYTVIKHAIVQINTFLLCEHW